MAIMGKAMIGEIPRKFNAQIKIQGTIITVCLLFGAHSAFFGTQQHAIGFVALGALLLYFLINIWPDMGYRFAWDDDTLYMRDRGHKVWPIVRHDWVSIVIDDIDFIEDVFSRQGIGKAAFMPFEFLKVYSRKDDDPMIWIHPASLNNYGVRIMLQHIHDRRPELLGDNVMDNFVDSEIRL